MNQTSLERFLLNRGNAWIRPRLSGASTYRLQTWIGSIFTGLGALMFLTGLMLHGSSQLGVMLGSIGLLAGGTANLLVAAYSRKKAASERLETSLSAAFAETTLTPEAQGFLANLAATFARRSRQSPALTQNLGSDLFELLEGASFQYNRAFGIITSAPERSQVSKVSRPCLLAADEAMSEILHQAAMISKFPESGTTAISLCKSRISSLTELADRLEAIQSKAPTLTDRFSQTSAMETMLEELRLTEMARAELNEQTLTERS